MINKNQINLRNIIAYIQGYFRYHIYYKYTFLKWLMPEHIWLQIRYRITVMDKECYDNGECKICGCRTTALQFANKECDKPCYPPLMSQSNFIDFLNGNKIFIHHHSYILKQTKVNGSNYVAVKLYKDDLLVNKKILPLTIQQILHR